MLYSVKGDWRVLSSFLTKLSKNLLMLRNRESFLQDLSIYLSLSSKYLIQSESTQSKNQLSPWFLHKNGPKMVRKSAIFTVTLALKPIKSPGKITNLFPPLKCFLFAEFSAEKNCLKFHLIPLLILIFFFLQVVFSVHHIPKGCSRVQIFSKTGPWLQTQLFFLPN